MLKKLESVFAIIIVFIMVLGIVIKVCSSNFKGNGVVQFNRKTLLSVDNNDMSPYISEGDLIFLNNLELSEYHITNVVGFISSDNSMKLGRIVDGEYNENDSSDYKFVVKADNSDDTYSITGDQVVGCWTMTRIPFGGTVILFLLSQNGFILGIVLPIALFFIFELILFIKSLYSERKIKKYS